MCVPLHLGLKPGVDLQRNCGQAGGELWGAFDRSRDATAHPHLEPGVALHSEFALRLLPAELGRRLDPGVRSVLVCRA